MNYLHNYSKYGETSDEEVGSIHCTGNTLKNQKTTQVKVTTHR